VVPRRARDRNRREAVAHEPVGRGPALRRKRSSVGPAGRPAPGHRIVAVALVSSGEVATIALEECNRRAAGLGPESRAVRLARIEQAPAPPSAEEQGSRSDHPRRLAGPVAQVANRRGPPAIGRDAGRTQREGAAGRRWVTEAQPSKRASGDRRKPTVAHVEWLGLPSAAVEDRTSTDDSRTGAFPSPVSV
jgi:hypothetical protein